MALYYPVNHSTAEQLEEMRRLEAAGVCLFCDPHLEADGWHRVLHRSAHWRVTPNRYPYRGTKHHLLLVPTDHVADLLDLPAAARDDFWTALGWIRATYELGFYGLAARCGDCRYTGGTVVHLHVHVIVGDVDAPGHEPVRFKLSSPASVASESSGAGDVGEG
jgi:diadenosine tetraphosphate (Ap4A) HIT family hydrolase